MANDATYPFKLSKPTRKAKSPLGACQSQDHMGLRASVSTVSLLSLSSMPLPCLRLKKLSELPFSDALASWLLKETGWAAFLLSNANQHGWQTWKRALLPT